MLTPIEAVVRELNTLNGVGLSASEMGFSYSYTDEATQIAIGRLFGKSGSLINAGATTLHYSRMDLTEAFQNTNTPVVVNGGNTVYGILNSLRRSTGLALTNADLIDAPITWVNDTASVTIAAKDTGQFWKGSVTLQLSLEPISLGLLLANPAVSVLDDVITTPGLLAAAQIAARAYVPFDAVVYGAPEDTTGVPTLANTRVLVTAIPGSGYAGSSYIYYDRKSLNDAVSVDSMFVFDDVVTGRDLVSYLTTSTGIAIAPSDVQNTEIDYSTNPAHYTLAADSGSLTYYGSKAIDVRRRMDNKQVITVNLTADDLAYTTQKLTNAITTQSNGIPFADVVINVASGVTIVGAASTSPTLVLGDVPGLTQIDYYINNHGTLYGRGGNGGAASSQGTPGQDGGNALSVTSTTARVFIDNQGRICGGGGGGGRANNSGRIGQSGGGAPLGVGTAGTASLTNPTNGTMGQEYPIAAYGGNGGCVGCVGNQSYMVFTSNGAVTNYGNGGKAGLVITGILTNVTWINVGSHLPFMDTVAVPTFTATTFTKAPQYSFGDALDSKRLISYHGYITDTTFAVPATLLNAIGYVKGSAETISTTTAVYVVIGIDGKFLLVPLSSLASGCQWDNIAASPIGKMTASISWQNQKLKPRMMQGANVNPVPIGSVADVPTNTAQSEYDRVFSILTSDGGTTTGYRWNLRTTAALGIVNGGVGSLILVNEAMDDGISHAARGGASLVKLSAVANAAQPTTHSLRPVLEWSVN